ncbi:MAG: UDP-glucose 4-epimerase, partial [Atribacterota bacterium]|nr:UDP-glucose 4-epimerase [Atribacterota bacterium]
YVEDVSRANVLALSAPSGVYNIGTGKETSVLALIELLERISGKEVHWSFGEEKKGEISRIALSFEKARVILHWSPEVSLEEGMRKTLNWFAERLL